MIKKLRADSLEGRLQAAGKGAAIEALERWLFEEGVTLSDASSRLHSEFGVSSGLRTMHRFYHTHKAERAVNRMKDSAELANMVKALGSEAHFDQASLALASQLTLDLASAPSPDVKALEALLKIVLKKREQDLSREKFELFKRKADAYDRAQLALTEAKNSGGITPETLKKIEAELKLL